jgi:PKD repeat protein
MEPAQNAQRYEGVGYTRIDFHPATSAFADFYVEGHRAGESVIFDDRSYSPVTGGVVAWLWTFGDGTMSTDENPVHTYACQGSYTVSLLVTDALNNVAMTQRTLTLTPERFTMTTTGGGVGDLCVTPPRLHCFPNVVRGHTLVSLDAHPGSVGQGPFLGLVPDMWTYFTLAQPPGSPNAFHFLAAPGIYPDIPLDVLPGFFSPLAGLPLDAVIIYFDGQGIPVHVSNVAQVVF